MHTTFRKVFSAPVISNISQVLLHNSTKVNNVFSLQLLIRISAECRQTQAFQKYQLPLAKKNAGKLFQNLKILHYLSLSRVDPHKLLLINLFIRMGKTSKGGFYAVARGRQVGIFSTWNDCQQQVNGFANARFKKFGSQSEAEQFIRENKGEPQNVLRHQSPAIAHTQGNNSSKSNGSNLQDMAKSECKDVWTVNAPRAPIYQFPAPSRLQQTRTAILINSLHRPSTNGSMDMGTTKRCISTSSTLQKRGLRVTEDRVTGVKRLKREANTGVDLSTFQVDEEGYVTVFTDGACSKNGRKAAKAGIGVWFGDDHNLNISEPVLGRQTNNTAEIQAAERAISQAKKAGVTKLKLKTDSQFTINCVTMWLNKWKRNNWKLTTGQDVKNREDLVKLDQVMSGIEIKWSYVQGHKGHYGNERADSLAVAGANMPRT